MASRKITARNPERSFEEMRDLFPIIEEGKKIWEATFDAIVDPVMIVNSEFIVERANLAAAHSAGVPIRELIGKRCYEQFAKRSFPCEGCPWVVSSDTHAPERKRLQPYADQRQFLATAFPIQGKGHEKKGLAVLQYQDLRVIRKLEEQLLQNEKMAALGLFASGIAHDINNPLSGVLAFAQLAMQGLDPATQTYQDLKEIETSALRCKKIIEDLLSFARPSSKSERVLADLGQIVRRILPSLEVQWKGSEYRLELDLPPLVPLQVSEIRFEQVFTNILTNAFQAIQPGGTISVKAGEEEDKVYVEVRDDGRGIDPKHLKSIFDPYFTTKREKGGMGLGLPICYNIVKEHGGSIEVKSDLGRGTQFRISVPKGRTDEKSNTGGG